MVLFIIVFFGSALYYVLVMGPAQDDTGKDSSSSNEVLDNFKIPKKGGALQQ
jgi:hypothetical protein